MANLDPVIVGLYKEIQTLQKKVARLETKETPLASAFAGAAHTHDGADIATGTVVDARIDALLARDAEVFGIVLANDGVGSGLNADLLQGILPAAFALLAGRSGGQTLNGGTGSGENLGLSSTPHATKGKIFFGSASAYDEVNDRLGLGTLSPLRKIHISHAGTSGADDVLIESGTPDLAFRETDGAADNKVWDIIVSGEQLLVRVVNDALSVATAVMTVDRTGTTVDAVTFPSSNLIGAAGKYAAFRTVRALDANGLSLFDDGGTVGLTIGDDGNLTASAGKYLGIRMIRALDANGLTLANSAGVLIMHLVNSNGNVGFGTDTQFGSGESVIGIANRGVAPSTNPSGGFVMYGESGAGKGRGSSGTVSTFIPAEPHCLVCGSDYAVEFDNQKWGYFTMCLRCLAEHIGDRPWIIRDKSRLS